jgi:hypothetical protein
MDRAQGRDLESLQFEPLARSGDLDPTLGEANAASLLQASGWYYEDTFSLLGQDARCPPVEVVGVPVRDKSDV